MSDTVRIGTLNVRRLNNKSKRRTLFNQLRKKKKKVDIACLQETYVRNDTIHDIKREWKGKIIIL